MTIQADSINTPGFAEANGDGPPFAAAVRATRMPMIFTDPRQPDNPIVFANDAFCDLTGYPRDEILGRNCRFLQGPASDPITVARIGAATASAQLINVEIYNYRKDGTGFWNRLHIVPVRDAAGVPRYFFASQSDFTTERALLASLQRDNAELGRLAAQLSERSREQAAVNDTLQAEIAERKRVENALRHASKMEVIGNLTSGIAHDFNNRLTAVSGYLELLQSSLTAGDMAGAARRAEAAMVATTHAAGLARRLLTFGRRKSFKPEPVDPNGVVHALAPLLRQTLGGGNALDIALAPAPWHALCDANQLENALLNLAINARDAMADAGNLRIATANVTVAASDAGARCEDIAPGDYVMITVADNGAGMAPDVMARAFEPFFTTKPPGEGTGLGLAMVHDFVRQSGGHVRIVSAPGAGTTFELFLPRNR